MKLSETAQDRIIGAVFLLSVAGIVLPMWMDGEGIEDLPDVEVNLPPAEPSSEEPIASPEAPTEGATDDWAFVDEVEKIIAEGPLGPANAQGERTPLGHPQELDVDETDVGETSPARLDGESEGVLEDTADALPWSIQLGSFGSLANGQALKDKLIAAGYHAYVTEGQGSDGKPFVRVSVGPILDRAQAEKLRGELAQKFDTNGILKRFDL